MIAARASIENDVRRRYNRRVLFCIRIKGASLLLGFWDLFIHSAALCALIFMFGRPSPMGEVRPVFDGFDFRQPANIMKEPFHDSPSSGINMENKNFASSNVLLNRILEKRMEPRSPLGMKSRDFYSHMDFMTAKWTQSLSQQDKYVLFFVLFSATILTLVYICGVLTNKASYIVPYFLIKVFNVIVSILTMLGFYAYLPDITVWLRMQPEFPFKHYLLELDTQTLQLVVFTLLLFTVLAKLYIAAIVWYCYGYVTALNMARALGTITGDADSHQVILGEMYSPPKYEEAIKSYPEEQEDYAPPPYTPLLSS